MTKSEDTQKVLLDACMNTLLVVGWKHFSFEQVSEASTIPLEAILKAFPSKEDLLSTFLTHVEQQTREQVSLEGIDTLKDQLFELILTRLDILKPYKKLCQDIYEEAVFDPFLACTVSKKVNAYLIFVSEASFPSLSSCSKPLVISILFGIYVLSFRQWLQDSSVDLGPTFAFIDQSLTYVLPFIQILQKI